MNDSASDRTRSPLSSPAPPPLSTAAAAFHRTRNTRSLRDAASFASPPPGECAKWSIQGPRALVAIATTTCECVREEEATNVSTFNGRQTTHTLAPYRVLFSVHKYRDDRVQDADKQACERRRVKGLRRWKGGDVLERGRRHAVVLERLERRETVYVLRSTVARLSKALAHECVGVPEPKVHTRERHACCRSALFTQYNTSVASVR